MRWEWHGIHRFAAAVKIDEVVFFSKNRGRLVEEATIHADEFIFRTAAELREIQTGHLKRIEAREKHRRRHFQGGGTRKPGTGRQGGFIGCLKPTGFGTRTGKHLGDTQRIVDPLTGFFQACGALDFSLITNART